MAANVRLVATKRGVVEFIKEPLPVVDRKSILVKTLFSGISHGTEAAVIKGTVPTFYKHWRKDYRIYTKGTPSKIYPCALGYENVGKVIKVGAEVKDYKVGDIVWSNNPHQTFSVITPQTCCLYKLSDKKYSRRAIFLALTAVALGAVHDAKIKIGDRVAVVGLGTVGLITLQLASVASQSKVFGVDLNSLPLKKAKEFSAVTLDASKVDPAVVIHEQTEGKGVDIAIETSGTTKGIHEAIRACRVGGRVVTVGTYREGAKDLFLAEEWHRNRIEMISSMIVNEAPHRDYPRRDLDRLNKTALQLLMEKKIDVESLITQTISFKDGLKAYTLLLEHPTEAVKILFTY